MNTCEFQRVHETKTIDTHIMTITVLDYPVSNIRHFLLSKFEYKNSCIASTTADILYTKL